MFIISAVSSKKSSEEAVKQRTSGLAVPLQSCEYGKRSRFLERLEADGLVLMIWQGDLAVLAEYIDKQFICVVTMTSVGSDVIVREKGNESM